MKDIFSIIKTILSAIIGVGSKKNLIKDFDRAENQSPWPYIISGLAVVIIFVLSILLIVSFVLS